MIGYGDNMLIARAFPASATADEPAVEPVDPQQELAALSGVQVAVGLMSGFPVSSSGSRTALAISARARSQLYSLVAAAFVVLVLFVAGPLMRSLPQASLAAVVFYATRASRVVAGGRATRPLPPTSCCWQRRPLWVSSCSGSSSASAWPSR